MKEMLKADAEKRIKKLREVIDHHRYLYHVEDRQEISDAAHDSLKHELYELEQLFPELITTDSPTQRVGGQPLQKFEKIKHKERMLSMEDVFSEIEFLAWAERLKKVGGRKIEDFYCMTKIDGLAVSLTYKNGLLENAATRGDGRVGEDITQNAKTIDAIPLKLRDVADAEIKKITSKLNIEDLKGEVNVRGEIYMGKRDFDKLNVVQKKAGKPEFANPRNVSAGSVRQLDSKVTASRPLDFRAWHLSGLGDVSHDASMAILKLLGFKVAEGRYTDTVGEVREYLARLEGKRDKLDYWIDGLVVRVNDAKYFRDLGVVGKTPRGLVAWKFAPEEATTQVESVDWFVGRTGKLTPVATVRATFVAGTTVTHATLHNADEIERLGIRIGDTVILTKAGDIIPKITKVLTEMRDGSEKIIAVPKKCPVCESDLVQKKGAVDITCLNKSCFSMERERILHAARAFQIDGLGGRTVENFINAGLLSSPPDLFTLDFDEISGLEGYGEVSAKKLIDEIGSKKMISFQHFIVALSIPNVGAETSLTLARTFGTLEKLKSATKERLTSVQDVGGIVAESIVEFFASERSEKLLEDYEEAGVIIEMHKTAGSKFENMTFVLTGTLEKLTRDEAKVKVQDQGGSVSGSVSKKTNFVVAGANAGSKLEKAKKLGVTILSEEDFLRKLK